MILQAIAVLEGAVEKRPRRDMYRMLVQLLMRQEHFDKAMHACKKGHSDNVRMLLSYRVYTELRSVEGLTALDYASDPEIIEALRNVSTEGRFIIHGFELLLQRLSKYVL